MPFSQFGREHFGPTGALRPLEQDFIKQRAERSLSRGLIRRAESEQRPGLPRRYAASVFLIADQTVCAKRPWAVSVMAFSDRGL